MKTLPTLRVQIDRLDRQILTFLNRRAILAQEVGAIKQQTGAAIFVPEREESLLEGLLKSNTGPLTAPGLRAIYREILSASRACQKPLRVGYLGRGEGPTLAAARARFGDGETYVGVPTPSALIRKVKSGKLHVGLLPRAEMQQSALPTSDRNALGRDVWLCSEIIVPQSERKRLAYLLVSPVLPAPLEHNRTLFLLPGTENLVTLRASAKLVDIQILEAQRVVIGQGQGWLIEIDGHLTNPIVTKFFQTLTEKTLWHHVLGSYPKSNIYGE